MTPLTFLVVSAVLGLACSSKVSPTRTLAMITNDFSQNLYQHIGHGDMSLIYSPYSIHSALSMTSMGAGGDTLKEMQLALGLSTIPHPHRKYKQTVNKLNSAKKVTMKVANGLFTNPAVKFKHLFEKAISYHYHATAEHFDLQAEGGPEKKINDFVAEKTNDVIQNLLPEGSIASDTSAVLVNTIFFNGSWDQAFVKRWTKPADFHKSDGSVTKVDLMETRVFAVGILHDKEQKMDMVDLPFVNKDFSLFIVMPWDNETMANLESDPAHIQSLNDQQSNITKVFAIVKMPKFKIETELKLVPTLEKMGIKKAFHSGLADFSRMTHSNTSTSIDEVIHKAVIDVSESGTIASAATAVKVVMKSAFHPKATITLLIDRPFLFFLKEKSTNQILFQGKFTGN